MTRIYNRLKINQFSSFPLFDKPGLLGTRNDGYYLIVIGWKTTQSPSFPLFDRPGLLGTRNDGAKPPFIRTGAILNGTGAIFFQTGAIFICSGAISGFTQ
jgi:hypothetical protein